MNGHGSKFGRKKEQALAALLSHRNVEESAKAAGISSATLKRWLQLPEFKAAYLAARREAVLQANARIQQNSGAAAATDALKGVSDLDGAIAASGDEKARNELRSLRVRFLDYIIANFDKLKYSPELIRYLCTHDNVVIVESVPVNASTVARDAALVRFPRRYP